MKLLNFKNNSTEKGGNFVYLLPSTAYIRYNNRLCIPYKQRLFIGYNYKQKT